MSGRFDSTLAGLQSARSRAVPSNRLRRLTGDVQSQAGDQVSAPQTFVGHSPFQNLDNTFFRLRGNGRIRRVLLNQRGNERREWSLGRSVF